MKRLSIRFGIIISLFMVLLCTSFSKVVTVEILALNDFHGYLAQDATHPGIGIVAAYINQERAQNPNVVLLSVGDMYQGTMESNLVYGASVAAEMNYLKFDAMTVGNHEFDWGQKHLQDRIKQSNFPFLGANIYQSGTNQLLSGVKPYTMVNVNGIKVGIIGVITLETPLTQLPSNLTGITFKNPNPIIAECVKELKAQGAQIIILDAHMSTFQNYSGSATLNPITGEGADVTAANSNSVDVSITGHSHQFVNGWVSGTSTVQADWAGKAIDKISVQYDTETNKIISVNSQVVNLMGSALTPDPQAMRIYNEYAKSILPIENRVIGYSNTGLSNVGGATTTMGNWATDQARVAENVSVFIINTGGVRTSIPKGTITMGELYSVFPFDNVACTTQMTGAQLKNLMEYCVSNAETGRTPGYFSGLLITYNGSLPLGQRIVKITDLQGNPIIDTKIYSVGTVDFVISGGDGFSMFSGLKVVNTGVTIRDVLLQQMLKQKVSDALIDTRLTIIH